MDTVTPDHAINMAGLIQATAHWLLTERPFKPQEQDYLLYINSTVFRLQAAMVRGRANRYYTGDRRRPADDTLRSLTTLPPLCAQAMPTAPLTLRLVVKKGGNEAQHMREFIADGGR